MNTLTLTRLMVVALSLGGIHGFRVEDQPNSFAMGEAVKLKVGRLTSQKTVRPMDYYQLPFCGLPSEGSNETQAQWDHQNLGQVLSGEFIQTSPYHLKMKEDMFCEKLCMTNLGPVEKHDHGSISAPNNKMVEAVHNNYRHNWILDNLPAASKRETDIIVVTNYWEGVPVGFISDGKAFVFNHMNIEVYYQNVDANDTDRAARIIKLVVEPFSIKHEDENPIKSCRRNKVAKHGSKGGADNRRGGAPEILHDRSEHTKYDMIYARGREAQLASGNVRFTYDVIWVEIPRTREYRHNGPRVIDWSNRWDIYVNMDNAIPAQVHWLSIANSFVLMIGLLVLIASIFIRNLRRGPNHYKNIVDDEAKAEAIIKFGWKLVHGDVCQAPRFSPLLLSACCGSGSQLLCTTFWTILLSAVGFLHPAKRGYQVMAMLMLYVLHSPIAGYITARFYKTFKGKNWQKAAAFTAFTFPGLVFGFWLIADMMALQHIPVRIIVAMLSLWVFLSTPLVFFGAHLGYKQGPLFPVTSHSRCPRPIPVQPWLRSLPVTLTAAAFLVFGVIFVEGYFILGAVWTSQYYYSFGFLFLVSAISMMTCAANAIVLGYVRLWGENHHWWWRSFIEGGSTGVAVFVYSVFFFPNQHLDMISWSGAYFIGYMGLVSFGLFLMTGLIGVSACMCFIKTMFAPSGVFPKSPHHSTNPGNISSAQIIEESGRGDVSAGSGIQSMLKKALVVAVLFVVISPKMVLLSPDYYHRQQWGILQEDLTLGDINGSNVANAVNRQGRNRSDDDGDDDNDEDDEEEEEEEEDLTEVYDSEGFKSDHRFLLETKMHKTDTPYVYGLDFTVRSGRLFEFALLSLLWAAIIALSVMLKRRSARPGGKIYRYNQHLVHTLMSERKRQLRDILNDPVLFEDMESRFGDLTSLLGVVSEWQSEKFPQKKDECVKVGKSVVVPWIRNLNVCLVFGTLCTFKSHFYSVMILLMMFVHLIDNAILYRAAIGKGAPKIAQSEGLFAAVGIPVIEVV